MAQFADPLIYLLLVAVVVSLVSWAAEGADGVPYEALVITAIIVLNGVLGYVQEARAEQAVAALQRMVAASATVVRDGREERVAAREVVPGDVMLVAEGDAVTADGRLVEAVSLTVAEAALTGESEAVLKDVAPLSQPTSLGDRVNMLFNGTAVTRGRGRAVVTATGMQTEMGRVAGLLGRTEEQRTPLQREVDRIGRMLGIAVIAIAVVVVAAILLTADVDTASDVASVLLVGVSLAVAAVPEGLPAVLSVVLALGVQRMARRRAIVKRLSSVETLGSASVVCSDKTGTLTTNEMTIEIVVTSPSGPIARAEVELVPRMKPFFEESRESAEAERLLQAGLTDELGVVRFPWNGTAPHFARVRNAAISRVFAFEVTEETRRFVLELGTAGFRGTVYGDDGSPLVNARIHCTLARTRPWAHDDEVHSGRHPDSDIFLDDVTVSRKHATFRREGVTFVVRDVGSLNGTYVNRERIDEAALQTGDEVQIGKFRLVFYAGKA